MKRMKVMKKTPKELGSESIFFYINQIIIIIIII